MIVSRATTQKITACLALLAVLLLFVAPVVSNSRAMQTPPPAANTIMDAESTMARHHAAMGHHDSGIMAEHSMMQEGFSCGYCELLIHVPLLLWLFVPFIWLTVLLARAPPLPRVSPPQLFRHYAVHHPRAPPALSLSHPTLNS